jgi:hypothetical protein
MSSPISISISIEAPAEDVWSELERVEDHVEWMADAVAIDFVTEQRRGVGTSFRCATKVGPLRTTDLMTITEWDDGRSMGVIHQGAVSGEGRFELSADPDGGTKVTWTENLKFPIWMGGGLGAWVARPVFHWIWRRNLDRLRLKVMG